MRRGRRLAIDVGDARIGVASCDPDGILATPVETVPGRDVPAAHRRLGARRGVRADRGRRRPAALAQRQRGPGRGQGRGFRPGVGAPHRPGPGAAGRRADVHGDGRSGTAGLGRDVQEGPFRGRPGGGRGDPAERAGSRAGVGQGHRGRASKWSSDRDTVTFRATRRPFEQLPHSREADGDVPQGSDRRLASLGDR